MSAPGHASICNNNPDSKVHGTNMGLTGPSGADRTQVGPMNFAIRDTIPQELKNT